MNSLILQVKDQKYKMFLEDYPQAKNETEARQKHEELKSNPELFNCAKDQTAFLNIFFGRMWHDLHSNKAFNDFLREKITRKLLKVKVSYILNYVNLITILTIMCCNDELSLTMSWVGCLLTDSELFISFAENSQILLKIYVIPILLTFIYLVALSLLVNNQLNSSLNSTHHCGT